MMPTLRAGKNELQAIAHNAMLQRGLLPDFSPTVIAQTDHITQAASPSGASVRDLRGLPWASIDNDGIAAIAFGQVQCPVLSHASARSFSSKPKCFTSARTK